MTAFSILPETLPFKHRVWVDDEGGVEDAHGNLKGAHSEPIDRWAIGFYDASSQEPVSSEYVARVVTNLMIQVSDPTIFHDQDIVIVDGEAFNVEGKPSDWAKGFPWAEYRGLFGGVINAKRVG